MSKRLCIYHIDLNFVNPRPDYLQAWLPVIADMGYNAILWELEDKVAWETCPDAVWPEAMSKKEFRAVLDQASDLGLEAIPLLQTIGHGEYILKQDAYRSLRELPDHHDCYCTENPETRAFLKQLITEYLDLFGPIRRFHLGGDEAYVFAECPTCAAEAERIGRNALYARHILDISTPIRERGARAGIWCDMALAHPEQIADIPTDLDIWDWNYWTTGDPSEPIRVWGKGRYLKEELPPEFLETFPEAISPDGSLNGFYTSDVLKRKGYDVILCSAARASGDSFFVPQTRIHAGNIGAAAKKAATADLLGTCVTSWAVRLNRWETHRFFLPLAPMLLAHPSADVTEALRSVGSDLFGCDPALFIEAVDLISGMQVPFGQARSTAVQWDRLKDSLPAPEGYIRDLLNEWRESGRLDSEMQALETSREDLARGLSKLAAFVLKARAGFDILHAWTQAASFQLWQVRMAREILRGRRSAQHAAFLRSLKNEYEHFLRFDQTPRSAAQNAGLVYDALIEYMGG